MDGLEVPSRSTNIHFKFLFPVGSDSLLVVIEILNDDGSLFIKRGNEFVATTPWGVDAAGMHWVQAEYTLTNSPLFWKPNTGPGHPNAPYKQNLRLKITPLLNGSLDHTYEAFSFAGDPDGTMTNATEQCLQQAAQFGGIVMTSCSNGRVSTVYALGS